MAEVEHGHQRELGKEELDEAPAPCIEGWADVVDSKRGHKAEADVVEILSGELQMRRDMVRRPVDLEQLVEEGRLRLD